MTAQIALENVQKHYGTFHALKDIDLAIPKGQFVALVGPSGCGKSTLLRSIAGLESISGGVLKIDGAVVNDLPPRKRDLAMVFQSYALYPHMSVQDNLTYALRLKRVPKAERAKQAEKVAAIIGLEDLLDRKPRELSGGQRQRVAMGRAIIREPKAFLFDEPLSNLDAALRVRMRKEVRALHDRIGATSVYVTHDQIEAMTMADHVVVLQAGVIEQQGAPMELYDRPANRFVAGFIGSPAMNFVPGVFAEDGTVRLEMPGAPEITVETPGRSGQAVIVGMRPEHLAIGEAAGSTIRAEIDAVEQTGSSCYLFTAGDPEVLITTDGTTAIKAGDRIELSIAPGQVHLFDPESGLALRG
ncbi:ABC transporter ATP-binding protein [Aestuariibius sp. 2305UL40-4]|uniref:ABC transporter ATP-binding protein n=1 Tax=Aestuariibius violaceus TaxID=3234132 RepID=UPI00345E3FE0